MIDTSNIAMRTTRRDGVPDEQYLEGWIARRLNSGGIEDSISMLQSCVAKLLTLAAARGEINAETLTDLVGSSRYEFGHEIIFKDSDPTQNP